MLKEERCLVKICNRAAGKLKEERTVGKPVGGRRRGAVEPEEQDLWCKKRRAFGATTGRTLEPQEGSCYSQKRALSI